MNSPYEFPPYSIFKPRDNKFEEVKVGPFNNDYIGGEKTYVYSLIIPAYNEENRIGPFLDHLKENLSSVWEIIVVCDGNDRTAEIAKSHGKRFNVLEFKSKLGKGGAIIEGFRRASGNVIGYVDADGALSSKEILKVFSRVDLKTPVAIASRWIRGSQILTKQPMIRIILGRIYHYVTFATLGITAKDTQCGLKAYDAEVLMDVMKRLKLMNMSIDTAILYHLKLLGYEIVEVPVTWRDVEGSKFSPFKTSLTMFATLVGLRLIHKTKSKILKEKLSLIYDLMDNI